MMTPLISAMVVVIIVVTAIIAVLNFSKPAIDMSKVNVKIKEAENYLKFMDDYIKEVSYEMPGSSRVSSFFVRDEFRTIPIENAMEFRIDDAGEIFEPYSRKFYGNIIYISGSDVNCSSAGNLTMENSFLRAVFQKIDRATPPAAINTSKNMLQLTEKTGNTAITFF